MKRSELRLLKLKEKKKKLTKANNRIKFTKIVGLKRVLGLFEGFGREVGLEGFLLLRVRDLVIFTWPRTVIYIL